MRQRLASLRLWPTRRVALALFACALAVRVIVVVAAGVVVPSDNAGDVGYFSQLVHSPWAHLHHSPFDIAQYAPYLGYLLWLSAKPWLAMGVSATTAFRLSSVCWDLLAMVLVLRVAFRHGVNWVWTIGLAWAFSPLVLPASAYAGQDETISAVVVATMVLLTLRSRRTAAVVIGVVGLFAAKILLAPVVLALLVSAPRSQREKAWWAAAITFLTMVLVTLLLSNTDGITQQTGYATNDLGFSITLWSSMVLHHWIEPTTAIHASVIVAGVVELVLLAWWWTTRRFEEFDGIRLAAALTLAPLAVLAVSNPEYLCLVAPVALVGALGDGRRRQIWWILANAGVAWAINLDYYVMRRNYDPTGTVLGQTGFGIEGKRVRVLDLAHQGLLALFLVTTAVVVTNFLRRRSWSSPRHRRRRRPRTALSN